MVQLAGVWCLLGPPFLKLVLAGAPFPETRQLFKTMKAQEPTPDGERLQYSEQCSPDGRAGR